MKKVRLLMIYAGILALALAGPAMAQRGRGVMGGGGMGGGMSGGMGGRMYDPQTVTTLSGQVASVDTFSGPRGYRGIHLTLKTDKETIPAHLGPSWFMDQQAIKFAAQDMVEITGSQVTFNGKPAIIAAEVKKGGQILKLRDANGIPRWAGQGRRR